VSLYIVSLLVGILVGVLYSALQVKSPAPPVVALIGLLGILIGESAFPVVKEKFFPTKIESTIQQQHSKR
jgi:XapX domain-containing protein